MATTVSTLNMDASAIREKLKKGVWYANGRWWILWIDNDADDYVSSSADGITWTAPIYIIYNNRAYKHSVTYANGKLYYVKSRDDSGPSGLMVVYACNSDGTLSQLTQLTIPNYGLSSFESYHNVCVDTTGLVRVTFASRFSSNYVPMETRYDGSSFSYPIKVTGDTEFCNTTLPLTLAGGNIGVMYNNNTTTPRFSYGCDTWTAQNPSAHLAMRSAEEWCAVSDGNNSVYMVYATQSGLVISIWLRKFYMGLGWTAPKLITSGNIGGPTGTAPVHPRITMDLYGNTYIFWVVNSRYVWYVKVLSIVGLNSGTLLTSVLLADEGATSNISQMQLPESMNALENIGVAWTNNLAIRFTFLNPVTPIQPPIWAVSEGEYDRAFDTFPSYVRVGSFHNRRTRRGLCAV